MNLKRFATFLIVILLLALSLMPISATPSDDVTSEIIYLENGDYIEISPIRITENKTRSTTALTASGERDVTYYDSNDEIEWQYVLTATFTYEPGVSATCTRATYSNTINDNNWTFSNGAATKSGNMAYGVGTYVKKILFITVETYDINIDIMCDTYGNLS